jgi:hypothetical protein
MKETNLGSYLKSVYTNDKFCHLDPIINAICYTIKALFFGHIEISKEQEDKYHLSLTLILITEYYPI